MAKFIFTGLIGLALTIPSGASAQVLINEIAWMGTTVSANYEWLELFNNSDIAVNLDGWQLNATDGTPVINLSGTIESKSYFLLERSGDETVPGISADNIFSGSLGNTGENLQLFESSGNLIDEASFISGWPGGDNITKQTLERASLTSWLTSLTVGGTPKAKNSTAEEPTTEDPPAPECPAIPECPQAPECPVAPECPETPEYPQVPECPVIPECPQCPAIPECPEILDLNEALEISAEEIPNIADGQKIIIQGKVTRRPIVFLGHFFAIDNLKILILDKRPPRLRHNLEIEVSGRLLKTPLGSILIVYQTEDITVK